MTETTALVIPIMLNVTCFNTVKYSFTSVAVLAIAEVLATLPDEKINVLFGISSRDAYHFPLQQREDRCRISVFFPVVWISTSETRLL